jgi:hypothetical protein
LATKNFDSWHAWSQNTYWKGLDKSAHHRQHNQPLQAGQGQQSLLEEVVHGLCVHHHKQRIQILVLWISIVALKINKTVQYTPLTCLRVLYHHILNTEGLQSLRQSAYTTFTLELKTAVESAPRREGVQLKEQCQAQGDSIHHVHGVHRTAFHTNVQ